MVVGENFFVLVCRDCRCEFTSFHDDLHELCEDCDAAETPRVYPVPADHDAFMARLESVLDR